MFGEFHGLPVHALVVHVVVVFAPVSALIALAYVVPRWRHVLRWPLAGTAVIAAGSAWVATRSGEKLKESLGTSGKLIEDHQNLGGKLFDALLVFAVIAVVVLALARMERSMVGHGLAVLLAVVALVVMYLTYQTGEKGAKAVWNPQGKQDFSGS